MNKKLPYYLEEYASHCIFKWKRPCLSFTIACLIARENNIFMEEFCQEFLFVHNNNKIIMVIRSRNVSLLTFGMQTVTYQYRSY